MKILQNFSKARHDAQEAAGSEHYGGWERNRTQVSTVQDGNEWKRYTHIHSCRVRRESRMMMI